MQPRAIRISESTASTTGFSDCSGHPAPPAKLRERWPESELGARTRGLAQDSAYFGEYLQQSSRLKSTLSTPWTMTSEPSIRLLPGKREKLLVEWRRPHSLSRSGEIPLAL